jgi:2-methylcitrate dehydratase PrpD
MKGPVNLTEQLIAQCFGWQARDLPPEAADKAKYLMLDFIGVAARGALSDSSRAIHKTIAGLSLGGTNPGAVVGTGLRFPQPYDALANGAAAHSLELDDTHQASSLHPGVGVFPAALAAANVQDTDGKSFLKAVTLGFEATIRLGKAVIPGEHYARGFHPTGTCGTFGATLVVSWILGLDPTQTRSAFGIAGSQTAASMEFLTDGAWTKRLHPGWAAHNGFLAASMAKNGFRGPHDQLGGKYGFLHAYSNGGDAGKLTEDFGKPFEITRTSVKPHACCRYNQAAIDAALKLRGEHSLDPARIKTITVRMLKVALPIVCEPETRKRNPRSVVDAQFSLPFAVAVALLNGSASLADYTEDVVGDPRMQTLMNKVEYIHDTELDRNFPEEWPAAVTVETDAGVRHETLVRHPKGDPENPLTWAELEEKFRMLTNLVYSSARQDAIITAVKTLDEWQSLRELPELLAADVSVGA